MYRLAGKTQALCPLVVGKVKQSKWVILCQSIAIAIADTENASMRILPRRVRTASAWSGTRSPESLLTPRREEQQAVLLLAFLRARVNRIMQISLITRIT